MSPCPKCGGKGIIKTLCDDFDNLHTCENCLHRFTPQNLILKETEMLSNTKLTVEQKKLFKDMLADYPHIQFATDFDSIVCAYFQDGKVVRFAFSVKSDDEKKFRLKVGKFNAMQKALPEWDNNENTILPEKHFFGMLETFGMGVLEFKSA